MLAWRSVNVIFRFATRVQESMVVYLVKENKKKKSHIKVDVHFLCYIYQINSQEGASKFLTVFDAVVVKSDIKK